MTSIAPRPSSLCCVVAVIALVSMLTVAAHATTMALNDEISYTCVPGEPPADLTALAAYNLDPTTAGSATLLSGVPVALWWYGCTATSAGMLFGYYDNLGYSNMLTATITGNLDTAAERDLIATSTHITDYWTSYGSSGPDPWVSADDGSSTSDDSSDSTISSYSTADADPWEASGTEHTWSTCVADFLGTNQWKWDWNVDGTVDSNTDGSTTFFSYSKSGNRLYDYTPSASCGLPQTEAAHGLRLFAESRGYEVAYEDGHYMDYTQKLDTLFTGGFSFADWMAEIDAGRPLLMQLDGHTMLGMGYDAAEEMVCFYDTWSYDVKEIAWGASYSGMQWLAVTTLKLDALPEPGTLALFGMGLPLAALLLRRRRKA
jgi:hypothetical protein